MGGAELAQAVGREAAPLSIGEAAYFLTGLYTTLLAERERGALGAFYTPPALATRLLNMAEEHGIDWTRARVLDPASGGGAFLLPAAERMIAALPAAEPAFVLRQIGTRLVGLELDPYAAGFGQNVIELLLADVSAASGRPAPTIVRVADTLEEPPSPRFDLVIGNPPYGRVTLTPEQLRARPLRPCQPPRRVHRYSRALDQEGRQPHFIPTRSRAAACSLARSTFIA